MDDTAGVGERGATSTPSAALPALVADDPALAALTELHDAARDAYADGLYPDEAWCARLNNAAANLMLVDPSGTAMADLALRAAALDGLIAALDKWRPGRAHPEVLDPGHALHPIAKAAIAAALAAVSPEDER